LIALQGEDAPAFETVDADRLCATSVKLRQTRFGAKPHRAVLALGDCVHAI
jgi:hypothetical protein